jgi:hypothetical protein
MEKSLFNISLEAEDTDLERQIHALTEQLASCTIELSKRRANDHVFSLPTLLNQLALTASTTADVSTQTEQTTAVNRWQFYVQTNCAPGSQKVLRSILAATGNTWGGVKVRYSYLDAEDGDKGWGAYRLDFPPSVKIIAFKTLCRNAVAAQKLPSGFRTVKPVAASTLFRRAAVHESTFTIADLTKYLDV